MEQEIWLPIPNYEGIYEVSSLGNVRSLDRYVELPANKRCRAYSVFLKGKILRPGIGTNGYYLEILCKDVITKQRMVHLIVADVFLHRPANTGLVVNHKNGIKTDNRVSNLEIVTIKENTAHAIAMVLVKYGYNGCRAKLTLEQVKEIQYLKRLGFSNSQLGTKFNISDTTIQRAVHYVFK